MKSSSEFAGKRVAFVSTRIAGKDGVSLEIEKWAAVLQRLGVECFYVAGQCDRPAEQTVLIPEAHFQHPAVLEVTQEAFRERVRPAALTDKISQLSRVIRDGLHEAVSRLRLDAIIAQNALTIPMNIPLGLALVQLFQETGMGCVAHHHDFYWERERYQINGVEDYLRYAFPPSLRQIQHVVINSVAAEEFSRRSGLYCRIIPNVMDFANPPPLADEYALSFRDQLGLDADELLVLQPTRVVARKGIEHSIELIRRLERPARLVITHAAGDEGEEYANFLRLFSDLLKVNVLFAEDCVADERGTLPDGRRTYTLEDVYQASQLVAYPSEYEGFGNAFLEAIWCRCPILCKRYPIYRQDIEPCGFQDVTFDNFLTGDIVRQVRELLDDPQRQADWAAANYELGRRHFSYEVLEEELRPILRRAFMQREC